MAEFLPNLDEPEEANFGRTELVRRDPRYVYIVTYSQADIERISDRGTFAEVVKTAFEGIGATVQHWVCCMEKHQDGNFHYHCALKLSRRHRWFRVKQFIHAHYGIQVHFSDVHCNYYSAWRYVTKEDVEFIESQDHPDLNDAVPRTTQASQRRRDIGQGVIPPKKRKTRLTPFDVSQFLRAKNIKTEIELLALAEEQRLEGKTDLAEFIMNRGSKWVNETLRVSKAVLLLRRLTRKEYLIIGRTTKTEVF